MRKLADIKIDGTRKRTEAKVQELALMFFLQSLKGFERNFNKNSNISINFLHKNYLTEHLEFGGTTLRKSEMFRNFAEVKSEVKKNAEFRPSLISMER